VSLLIGTLARRLPLPGASSSSSAAPGSSPEQPQQPDLSSSSSDMLQPQQLAQLGDLLLSLLLSMKHNGAVEKSQPGVLWLAEQLLQSPRSDLNGLPAGWLARCMARVQQPGQCRDDIVRRSAGGTHCLRMAAAVLVTYTTCACSLCMGVWAELQSQARMQYSMPDLIKCNHCSSCTWRAWHITSSAPALVSPSASLRHWCWCCCCCCCCRSAILHHLLVPVGAARRSAAAAAHRAAAAAGHRTG
jgi:hypothetical protein